MLTVEGLDVTYGGVQALSNVSLSVAPGQAVAVVGESGSGKSTLLRAVARQLPRFADVQASTLEFDGHDLTCLPEGRMRALRGSSLGFLFQNGLLSLDPLFTIGAQFDEVLSAHGIKARRQAKHEALGRTGLENPERILAALPSQLSGGQCQRVALALALAGGPKLLLADEPTSALDSEAQRQVGDLLARLNREDGMALLLVTHDIDFAASMAMHLVVMRNGRVVEQGATSQVMEDPRHPYTRQLIDAVPRAMRAFRVVWSVCDGAVEPCHERDCTHEPCHGAKCDMSSEGGLNAQKEDE